MEEIGKNIWLAEGPIVSFYGFPYPTRSVIVRLPSGELWVWSPVELTGELHRQVESVGAPKHLVSPNKLHHLYLPQWHEAYGDALLWAPASTIRKRPDLPFAPPLEDEAPLEWEGAFDLAWFNGSLFMDEVVFHHRASHTAILADLSENFSERFLRAHWPGWKYWIAKYWGIVEGRGYAPLEWRLSFTRRAATRTARDRVLAWHPEQVVMAHGEWQRTGGRAYLEKAFSWIG